MLPLLFLLCLDCEEKALHRERGGADSCFQNVSSQFAAVVRAHRGVEGNDGKLRLLYEARHTLCALEGEGEIQHLRNLSWTCNTASERRSCNPFVLLQ